MRGSRASLRTPPPSSLQRPDVCFPKLTLFPLCLTRSNMAFKCCVLSSEARLVASLHRPTGECSALHFLFLYIYLYREGERNEPLILLCSSMNSSRNQRTRFRSSLLGTQHRLEAPSLCRSRRPPEGSRSPELRTHWSVFTLHTLGVSSVLTHTVGCSQHTFLSQEG